MKLGRNDPCHCGSGQKYKKCHYAADEAKRSAELAAQAEQRAAAAAEAAQAEASADAPKATVVAKPKPAMTGGKGGKQVGAAPGPGFRRRTV